MNTGRLAEITFEYYADKYKNGAPKYDYLTPVIYEDISALASIGFTTLQVSLPLNSTLWLAYDKDRFVIATSNTSKQTTKAIIRARANWSDIA